MKLDSKCCADVLVYGTGAVSEIVRFVTFIYRYIYENKHGKCRFLTSSRKIFV